MHVLDKGIASARKVEREATGNGDPGASMVEEDEEDVKTKETLAEKSEKIRKNPG